MESTQDPGKQSGGKMAGEDPNGFEPKILALCCEHWAYSSADLAGSMRLNYPSNVKIVKIPCTGRVDILLILRTFESGVDGVYLAGCLEGECHFLQGNLRAKKRVALAKRILEDVGIGGDRLEMYNISASMGPRFAEIAREMTERIRKLGPSPIKKYAKGVEPSEQRKEEQTAERLTQKA